ARRSIHLLALPGERIQLRELIVVEAQLPGQLRRNALLDGAAVGGGADRDLLDTGRALAHHAGAIHAEAVGDDAAGYDDLAEPPARLDQPFVGLIDRVLREHHAGDVGIEQGLDDDTDARTGKKAHPLAVGDRRVGVR